MTDKECLNELERIQQECLATQRAAYNKKMNDINDVLMTWANSSSPCKPGDFIVSGGEALEVINIKGIEGTKKNRLVRVYHCRVLTKNFRPRADGKEIDIFDNATKIRFVNKE